MLTRLLLFGATGDMAARLLLPAAGALLADGVLPADFHAVGTARTKLSTEDWQREIAAALEEHASDLPTDVREDLVSRLEFIPSDVANVEHVKAAVNAASEGGKTPIAIYLALPQALFDDTIASLSEANIPSGSRVIVEKPFGENKAEAEKLNAQLADLVDESEDAVFRVDHALGMTPLHNVEVWRAQNPAIESIWNSTFIDRVDVLWDEQLALEGRAGFYDNAGALKDVVQNHMLRVLIGIAKDLTAEGQSAPDARQALLERIQTIPHDEMRSSTRRARYTAGTVDGEAIPSYVDEDGVDPSKNTETYAEVTLQIDSERWRGTEFWVRTGKALGHRAKGVRLHFHPAEGQEKGSELWIGIDGPFHLQWTMPGLDPDAPAKLHEIVLASDSQESHLAPYAHVLRDILEGGVDLSVGAREAEEAWRIFDPIVDAWAAGDVPMEEYEAGADGLSPR